LPSFSLSRFGVSGVLADILMTGKHYVRYPNIVVLTD
jgi:hypothetical protein